MPTVPPEMASNMTSLRNLNLDYNDLTAVPIVTHSLTKLRHLSLAANPITVLTNTSLLGVAEHLEELDIRDFELNSFEVLKKMETRKISNNFFLQTGALCKMNALRTLQISVYHEVKNFNLPTILSKNYGLRNLEINVDFETNLGKEMEGVLPHKLKNITFSGSSLKSLDSDILDVSKYFAIISCVINK